MKLKPGERICLANLHLATEQQVFDQVVNHLLTQKQKASDGTCRYRDYQGRSCAAGCLISDAEYYKELEGNSWVSLTYHAKVPRAHKNLIVNLQIIHDSRFPDMWHRCLATFAKNHGLYFNPPTTNETKPEKAT